MSYYDFGPDSNGSLSLSPIFGYDPEFVSYYLNLTPVTNMKNPWFPRLWKEQLDCDWNTSAGNQSCYLYEDIAMTEQTMARGMTLSIDSVNAFALAIDTVIKEECPYAESNENILQQCVNGPVLLEYLRKVLFDGICGKVRFDVNGDRLGQFEILQYVHTGKGIKKHVGVWDKILDTALIEESLFD